MSAPPNWREPDITISGVALNFAQSMTMRVAIESFAMSLAAGLGDDETGKAIGAGYKARIGEIRELMQRTTR